MTDEDITQAKLRIEKAEKLKAQIAVCDSFLKELSEKNIIQIHRAARHKATEIIAMYGDPPNGYAPLCQNADLGKEIDEYVRARLSA